MASLCISHVSVFRQKLLTFSNETRECKVSNIAKFQCGVPFDFISQALIEAARVLEDSVFQLQNGRVTAMPTRENDVAEEGVIRGIGKFAVHELSNHYRSSEVMKGLDSVPNIVNIRPDGVLLAKGACSWSFVIAL